MENNKAITYESPEKTDFKNCHQISDINETNFDIEISCDKGLAQLDFEQHKTRENSKLKIGVDLEEQKNSGPPSSQPIKSKKALDTLATANLDLESDHEMITQDNLATIHENPEIAQAEEEKQTNEKEQSFENLEFKLDPQPVPEHKQRPQSQKPPIIGSQENVNNVSLDDVPDIDHCDQTISSLGSHKNQEDS